MQIIIAPARKMTTDTDSLSVGQLPRFLPFTRQILQAMQQLTYQQARKLWWNCSERIARPNYQCLFELELTKQLTPRAPRLHRSSVPVHGNWRLY